jgi:hypothetical protein
MSTIRHPGLPTRLLRGGTPNETPPVMRRNRWLAIVGLTVVLWPLAGGCDGLFSACVYDGGNGPCDDDVPQSSCEGAGGVYHGDTSCKDLGLPSEQPPNDSR